MMATPVLGPIVRRALRLVQLETHVADIRQPAVPILLQAAAQQPPDGLRGAWRKRRPLGLRAQHRRQPGFAFERRNAAGIWNSGDGTPARNTGLDVTGTDMTLPSRAMKKSSWPSPHRAIPAAPVFEIIHLPPDALPSSVTPWT